MICLVVFAFISFRLFASECLQRRKITVGKSSLNSMASTRDAHDLYHRGEKQSGGEWIAENTKKAMRED